MLIQGARQRRCLQQRHAMFCRDLADPRGDRIAALGDHPRRAHAGTLVGQCHRVVGRIGHHHVGGRHRGHHATARRLALARANLALDLRVTLGFAPFALDLVARHAQTLGVLPKRQRHIGGRDQYQYRRHPDEIARDQIACVRRRLNAALGQRHQERCLVAPQQGAHGGADQRHLDDRLAKFGHAMHRKKARESLDRVDAGKIRRHGFGREQPPTDRQRRQQRCQKQHPEDGQGRQHAAQGQRAGVFQRDRRVEGTGTRDAQAVAQEVAGLARHRRPDRQQGHGAGEQQHRGGQFARTRRLATITCLVQALLRRR